MLYNNQINDLTPLENWETTNVQNFSHMFQSNRLTDLSPLAKWQTGKSTDFSYMFYNNRISDLKTLEKWDVKKNGLTTTIRGNGVIETEDKQAEQLILKKSK